MIGFKEAMIGAASVMISGASGWAVTSTMSNSTELATLKAVQEVQTKNNDERYARIEAMMKEVREGIQRIEGRQVKR